MTWSAVSACLTRRPQIFCTFVVNDISSACGDSPSNAATFSNSEKKALQLNTVNVRYIRGLTT